MEAVKDRLTGLRGNSRSLVVDADQDLVADTRDGDLDKAVCRGEADRIVEDRVERPRQPIGLAHYHGTVLAWSSEGDSGVARLAPRFPALDELLDEGAEVDRSKMRP